MTDGIQVALFDIAGTLTKINAWKGIVESPELDPKRRKNLMRRALPFWAAYKIGIYSEYRFRQRWVDWLANILADWAEDKLEAMFDWVVNTYLVDHYRTDVIDELQKLKASGVHVILVSSIFERFSQKVAERVGADNGIGSKLEFINGKATGKIIGQSCSGKSKVSFAEGYLKTQDFHLPLLECGAAYSDSISDQPMLEAVKKATVVYPDKKLKVVAEQKGWRILNGN